MPMCMFCAAMPVVVSATAVAQGEQRKKLVRAESHEAFAPHRKTRPLSPRRITQFGVLAFVGLLIGSAFYHTHLPG
jgi:hypothetical protein